MLSLVLALIIEAVSTKVPLLTGDLVFRTPGMHFIGPEQLLTSY
jgi:hypothetical protein